ncbi:MAG TPA: alpha-amylase family protein [Cyclobacteriaceae bacterium]|nr:alpha-amylase family protein [Cyclobacteriaceae bacterium]HMV89715.1 alpha-amylase family protein [Cyclobacteriaceae bacterium]HMY93323.1 alpha-amylase family protein [Cyclobacteriaceae bacterium]HNA13876.1 alpha-amylase family protein [Cyclobacteriaceae bacterium]HNC11469.1 alpha-amylase family protein [Cyclobacteriaceae bacterium]
MENKPTKMVVYQMMTRLFGNKTSVNKPYGTLAQNGVGKFNDINGVALRSIKELGITHVWYTGVIEHAVLTDYSKYGIALDDADVVKGRAGSPYAIKDYYDVNPDLAVNVPDRMKEFEQLVERTHSNGLKVLIDFVPNHVARAYKSDAKPAGVKDLGETDDKTVKFSANNNFYYLPGESFVVPKDFKSIPADTLYPPADSKFNETPAKVTGNNQFTASPGVNEWFETVKLNYGVDIQNNNKSYFEPIPDTWIKMKDILVFWANKKVDGFRCDMAEMVPVEFWNWAIPQVKAVNPEIVFVAEIYNPAQYRNYIQTGKFDYLYDKVQLYDTLRGLINNKRSARDIDMIQKSLEGINANMLHFLENHDEQRIASPDFAGNAWKIVPAMVVSATIDHGPVMIYFGQEVGEPGAGAEGFGGKDGRTTIFDYWGVPEHQKWMNGGAFDGGLLSDQQKSLRQFYGTLLNIAQTNPAIVSGNYFDLTVSDDVHAFVRNAGSEKLLIVSNFDSKVKPVKVVIPENIAAALQLKGDKKYTLQDLLWKNSDQALAGLTLYMNLPAYSAYIFKVQE